MARQSGIRTILFLAALSAGWAGPAWSQSANAPSDSKGSNPADRVVLSIGDQKLTAQRVEKIIESLPPASRAFYGGPGKKYLPQFLVQMSVLSDEAKKHNLQDEPDVQQAIENATEAILANAERERIEKTIAVSDQQLQELYQQQKGNFEEARIRHILIRTSNAPVAFPSSPSRPPLSEAEARKKLEDLRKQILAGADFGQLAQQYSDDLATAGAGGDMGYINRQKVVPPIADAAYALPPGQVSDLIQTPYGLEIIKVEDRRSKPFSEVRQELEAQVQKTKADQAIQQIISQQKVVVDKEFFSANSHPDSNASSGAQ
jgi:peptidyl-prolyl cis-trans isomerase C